MSERKVCNKTWRQIRGERRNNPKLRFDTKANEEFKAAIEKLRLAYAKEKGLKQTYESEVAQLSEFYGCQDDVQDDITVEDGTDLSELSDVSDSESEIHYRSSDSIIEGERSKSERVNVKSGFSL